MPIFWEWKPDFSAQSGDETRSSLPTGPGLPFSSLLLFFSHLPSLGKSKKEGRSEAKRCGASEERSKSENWGRQLWKTCAMNLSARQRATCGTWPVSKTSPERLYVSRAKRASLPSPRSPLSAQPPSPTPPVVRHALKYTTHLSDLQSDMIRVHAR